ncbi:unnamed protein product [Cochlearia groenlandica]
MGFSHGISEKKKDKKVEKKKWKTLMSEYPNNWEPYIGYFEDGVEAGGDVLKRMDETREVVDRTMCVYDDNDRGQGPYENCGHVETTLSDTPIGFSLGLDSTQIDGVVFPNIDEATHDEVC